MSAATWSCFDMDALLAMPKTEDLQAALEAVVTPPPPSHGQHPRYWIGLRVSFTNVMSWQDFSGTKSPVTYSNMCPTCVHTDTAPCFYLDSSVSFQWIRDDCNQYLFYICEKTAPTGCEFPSTPPNTLESLDWNVVGDVINYTCQTGYTLISGDLTRTCLTDGNWSGSPPICDFGGSWLGWGAWSSCSVTCGTGTSFRNRTCHDPNLPSELALCAGGATNSTQTLSCFEQHCPGTSQSAGTVLSTSCFIQMGTSPSPGICTVSPSTGFEIVTNFSVNCSGFSDSTSQLHYNYHFWDGYPATKNQSGILLGSSSGGYIHISALSVSTASENSEGEVRVHAVNEDGMTTVVTSTVQVCLHLAVGWG
ncbi:uncharacterized protein LOC106179922 [Lingula anatina]|uniref:Uncharacterized protein LOC106179922 n=1 Tax=Lingula anatina TaxID=7574 RepID=A0A2R2MTC0_LINAN|nr:uncharacterized protein LOC106179922 [Lingula anatina]|eukprot:XP_023933358.1 uncharacterized protein LOC106179922 [Lingula anatina]